MLPRVITVALLGLLTVGAAPPAARPALSERTGLGESKGPLPVAVEGAIQQVTAAELQQHVTVLASDELAGRGLGHAGNHRAEQYIASSLRSANVPPASPEYFQQIEVYQPQLGPDARLTVSGAGAPLADLAAGPDFYPLAASGDQPVTGPAVFAGHGITAPELKHDDYARIDARGAVVLVLEDVPDAMRRMTAPGQDVTEMATVRRKTLDARKHGAVRAHRGDPEHVYPGSLAGPPFGPLGVLSPPRADARGAVRGRGHLGGRRRPDPARARASGSGSRSR